MPPKPSILTAISAPSRLLCPSRLICPSAIRTIYTYPPRNTDPPHNAEPPRNADPPRSTDPPPQLPPRPRTVDFASAMESRSKGFSQEFESRLQTLRAYQPTIEPQNEAAGGEDKTVTDSELIATHYRFAHGDTYAPHDLSFQEQRARRARRKPAFDSMDLLGINPIKEYRNFAMMSEFVTEMGRIKHSEQTGLRPVNQRRMAKAIRRAIGLGLMPAVHKHPEVMGNARPDRKYIPKTW